MEEEMEKIRKKRRKENGGERIRKRKKEKIKGIYEIG
jgi:hypothetical protein